MFVPPKDTVKLANGKQNIPKDLGLFYVAFITVPLYIQYYQFIIVQVTLPTPSHQVPYNSMLDFKPLRLNLLTIVTLLTLKVVLGDHLTILKCFLTIFKSKLLMSTLKETGIFLSQLSVHLKKNLSYYSLAVCSSVYYHTKTNSKKRTHVSSPIKSP